MKFIRCTFEKNYAGRPITPQRLAAANRFAQKQRDKVALFPELQATVEDPKDRLQAFAVGECESSAEWRARRAEDWRRARRELAELPEVARAGLMRFWQTSRWVNHEPVALLSMILNVRRGKSYWSHMRRLRQIELIGQGKLPHGMFRQEADEHKATPWRFRDWRDRDLGRFRARRARKLGLLKTERQLQLAPTS